MEGQLVPDGSFEGSSDILQGQPGKWRANLRDSEICKSHLVRAFESEQGIDRTKK